MGLGSLSVHSLILKYFPSISNRILEILESPSLAHPPPPPLTGIRLQKTTTQRKEVMRSYHRRTLRTGWDEDLCWDKFKKHFFHAIVELRDSLRTQWSVFKISQRNPDGKQNPLLLLLQLFSCNRWRHAQLLEQKSLERIWEKKQKRYD